MHPTNNLSICKMLFDRTGGSLYYFFHGEMQGGKRATINTQEKSIIAALSLQCNCQFQCSPLEQSWSAGSRTIGKNVARVYDVLLGAQNVTTSKLLLAIGGKLF
jgi:hypothetical protein